MKNKKYIVLLASDIEKACGLKNRIVSICSEMYDCMNNIDEILHTTPSGWSTTVQVKYYL